MSRAVCTRHRALFAAFCLAAALPGCNRDGADGDGGFDRDGLAAEVFGSRAELTSKLDQLMEKSEALTEASSVALSPDAKGTVAWRPRKMAPLPGESVPVDVALLPDVPPPPGELMATLDEIPAALAVTDEGWLVYTDHGKVRLCEAEGKVSDLLSASATVLQLDGKGERLLAQDKDRVYVLSGKGFSERRLYDRHPPGRANWGEAPGELLFLADKIDFSATEKFRIEILAEGFDLESAAARPAGWEPLKRYCAIGTLPAAEMTWGHLSGHYQIDAMPAPLYLLDQGTPIAPLTTTRKAADVEPAADDQRNLFWIRTYRRGENSGRAFFRSGKSAPEDCLQITGQPTYRIAAAPEGPWFACCVAAKDGGYELWRGRKADIEGNRVTYSLYGEADEAIRARVSGVVDDLRDAFLRMNPGGGLHETPFGYELNSVPKPEEMDRLADALEDSLGERLNLRLQPGIGALRQLDAVFDQAGSYVSEEPPMILALAAWQARALGTDAEWFLETASPSIAVDYNDPTSTDDLSYTALSAFGVARERISHGMSLYQTAKDLRSQPLRPIYLAENFRAETVQGIIQKELRRSGSAALTTPSQDRFAAFQSLKENNNALNAAMLNAGRMTKDQRLALLAAWRLAMGNPTSGRAIGQLAGVLMDNYYSEEALRLYRQAVALAPKDADIRFAFADCLLSHDLLDEAEREYGNVRLADEGGTYTADLPGRLNLVAEMRSGRK